MSTRRAYRALSMLGTLKAARRGPAPLARRVARQRAHRTFAQMLRKVLKP